jgi:hypothetical protein
VVVAVVAKLQFLQVEDLRLVCALMEAVVLGGQHIVVDLQDLSQLLVVSQNQVMFRRLEVY